jgi:hypothetical protein
MEALLTRLALRRSRNHKLMNLLENSPLKPGAPVTARGFYGAVNVRER